MNAVTLYTFQTPGHDITAKQDPRSDYKDPGGPFFIIANYLGWDHWVWAFQKLQDFDNEWLVIEKVRDLSLWVLSVPETEVRWCDMELQCNRGMRPVNEWFLTDPELIREAGHIPEGLVRGPIKREWVKSSGI
jgi:hypothetical protein